MKTRNHAFLPLAAAMGALALTAVTTNADTIYSDFSNFVESGNLLLPTYTLDQDFTPSGDDITISTAGNESLGQEVFLSDEFPTLTFGARVSIDVPASFGGGDGGLAIASSEGITTRQNLLIWVWNGGTVTLGSFNGSGEAAFESAIAIAAPDTLFIDKTATGWSFGSILGGIETLHFTDISMVCRAAITADGSALGLWSDMRAPYSPRTLSNLTVDAISAPETGGPIINEFCADNDDLIEDEYLNSSDWLEIYNGQNSSVNLAGYYLTDDPATPAKWPFPAVTIPEYGYLLVFASGKDRSDPAGFLHTDFTLKKSGGYLALVAPDGLTVLSDHTFGAQ